MKQWSPGVYYTRHYTGNQIVAMYKSLVELVEYTPLFHKKDELVWRMEEAVQQELEGIIGGTSVDVAIAGDASKITLTLREYVGVNLYDDLMHEFRRRGIKTDPTVSLVVER